MVPNPWVFFYLSCNANLQDIYRVSGSYELIESCYTGQVQRNYSIIDLGRFTHLITSKIVRNTTLSYLYKYLLSPYTLGHSQEKPHYFITSFFICLIFSKSGFAKFWFSVTKNDHHSQQETNRS